MLGKGVLVGLAAALTAAGCDDEQVGGCGGAAVIIELTPSPADAGDPTDGGGADAKPSCTGGCDEYLEALRVAIEAATPAACARFPAETRLACTPDTTAPFGCGTGTGDATRALEPQIRDYLGAAWPEIDPAAVSLDTCLCHIN